jgi:hypothetical protein
MDAMDIYLGQDPVVIVFENLPRRFRDPASHSYTAAHIDA